ncbi:hypothetical protein KKG65_02040 [Patescibacteria group bacterium]|nr:hypothetical protein [Patescibacteria group bacterium]
MDLKTIFLNSYANVPLGLRGEIIVVLDGQPMTWNVVKVEVDSNTQKAKEILQKLFELGIIKNEK